MRHIRKDRIPNDYKQGDNGVKMIKEKITKNWLWWFGVSICTKFTRSNSVSKLHGF